MTDQPRIDAWLQKLGRQYKWQDSSAARLVDDAYRICVMPNIREPEGLLRRKWLAPDFGYNGHWIWDAMFLADLLSLAPGFEENLRDSFSIYWDFQDMWAGLAPEYAQGMVSNNVKPESYSPNTQGHCIIAWAMERISARQPDLGLVTADSLSRLERYHDWYWRERDIDELGLITVGTYAPLALENMSTVKWIQDPAVAPEVRMQRTIQSARFESFDMEACMDELTLAPHPRRGGPAMYGTILLPGITSFLIQAEQSLARLAEKSGDHAMAERRNQRAEKGIAAMRRIMWDEQEGTFLAVRRGSLEKIRTPTIGSWIPLWAGVPDKKQAEQMAAKLAGPDWFTNLPIPTVGRNSRQFDDGGVPACPNGIMWRGDVWGPTNYFICRGLLDYGYIDLAEEITTRFLENAMKNGLS
ncbi:MAG: trehalase family glycosidase, partial [Victivallales bacterium]